MLIKKFNFTEVNANKFLNNIVNNVKEYYSEIEQNQLRNLISKSLCKKNKNNITAKENILYIYFMKTLYKKVNKKTP